MFFDHVLDVNEAARLTNTTYPVIPEITSESFPVQNKDKLGTMVHIRIRDRRHNKITDDVVHVYRVIPAELYILRWDTTAPFIVIGVLMNTRYKGEVIVYNRESDEELTDYIGNFPRPKYNYLGIASKQVYHDFSFLDNANVGTIVRCDEGEPAYAVVAEILSDDKLRFVTSDEAVCMLNGFAPSTIHFSLDDIYTLIMRLVGDHELYGKSDE